MKNSLQIVKLEAHKVPEFKEERSKEWVVFGTSKGYRNQYPKYLLELYNRSAKHNAIINGKVDYVTGGGFQYETEGLNIDVAAKVQKFVNTPNKDQNLNTLLDRASLDLEIYNGVLFEVIYNKTNKHIASVYVADINKYRRAKNMEGWYYDPDGWTRAIPREKPKFIPDFDISSTSGKQILYVGEYNPVSDCYPIPSYIGCVPYIEMDVEIANFHLNSIKNGFVGGTMITFYDGVPSDEEKAEIERRLKDKHAGTDNANNIVLNFANGRESGGVDIDSLSGNDFDTRFESLNNQVQQELFSGHRVTDPNLFGIKQDGIFATRSQLVDSYELFKNTYIKGRQKFLLDAFNGLLRVQGLPEVLTIKDTEPISAQFSEATLVSVMTTDEIRERAGLPPLEKEQRPEEMSKTEELRSEDNKIVDAFEACGTEYKDSDVAYSRCFRFQSDSDAEKREGELRRYGFIDTAFEMGVLEILKEEPTTPYAEIAARLDTSVSSVANAAKELSAQGYLNLLTETIIDTEQRVAEITEQGQRALENVEPLEDAFVIAYKYVKSPLVDGPELLDTSRDFCKRMVGLSKTKVWSLKEIQDIGKREGYNVWLRKGGFYTRKGSNTTTPYCRHIWEQVVLKKSDRDG